MCIYRGYTAAQVNHVTFARTIEIPFIAWHES